MINKRFLILASLSTLLVTTALGAEKDVCVGGACMAILDKPQLSRKVEATKQIILDGKLVSLSSSYALKDAKTFPLEDEIVIVEEIKKIEDMIFEQTGLPSSTYYCENHKTALFDKYVDIYECV